MGKKQPHDVPEETADEALFGKPPGTVTLRVMFYPSNTAQAGTLELQPQEWAELQRITALYGLQPAGIKDLHILQWAKLKRWLELLDWRPSQIAKGINPVMLWDQMVELRLP